MNRPAGITPSNFAKVMTGSLGLTDKQQEKLQGYYDRTKPLTDRMKEEVADLEHKRDNPEWPQTCISYAEEVAMQLIGVYPDQIDTYWMERGKELEPLAREAYETRNFVTVKQKERIAHPDYKYIHGEPDGLVGEDEIIEIKCPNKANHLGNILTGKQLDDYMWQMQGYIWITGRQTCKFISYHPEFPQPLDMEVVEVKRNDKMIAELESRCVKMWNDLVMPTFEQLQERINEV